MTGSNLRASNDQINDLGIELANVGFRGEIRADMKTRLLYSTDASIYQMMPLGVAFPKDQEDIHRAVEICSRSKIPILARGSGSSLAGQAIGPALILDCSRYLTAIKEIRLDDPAAPEKGGIAHLEPGVILDNLNRAAKAYGLQFGPDPASAERATLGGSLANNATGAHSIRYGMAADHLLEAQVILSDGSLAVWGEQSLEDLAHRVGQNGPTSGRQADIEAAALQIREHYGELIRQRWPRTWRRASGYSLNYLIPWASSAPPGWEAPDYPPHKPGQINFASLLAGSEGTLGILSQATVRLVPLPRHTILGVLTYPSIQAACEDVAGILALNPAAVELVPQAILRAARSLAAYASLVDWVPGDPPALLVVEFSGDDPAALHRQVQALGEDVIIAESTGDQKKVWAVRKVGLGLLNARHGQPKPVAFIEDLAVPVERLPEFVREIENLLASYGTTAEMYAHASAGCLHIRPLLDLKNSEGIKNLHTIAQEAVQLTIRMGGSVSGEHGDGLARSEWLAELFGEELLEAMRQLKTAADPQNLLNPGKIVTPDSSIVPKMDSSLRFEQDYQAHAWQPVFSYTAQLSLEDAIEQCNGAAVCRKDSGVMCPSFQATQEEEHSTRGRSNLLRALISGQFPTQALGEKAVYEALDLCLACKGCKAECPSSVDMAKLRYEFMAYYYSVQSASRGKRRVRDYLFAYIGDLAKLAWPFAPLVNAILGSGWFASLAESQLGLARQHRMPVFHRPAHLQSRRKGPARTPPVETVLLLSDAFNEYFRPQVNLAAVRLLEAAGCEVVRLPVLGAGRTLISKGFLKPAQIHARRLVEAISRIDPGGELPIIGLEPSEIYTLLDEYTDLLPDVTGVTQISERSWMIDEFLLRLGKDRKVRYQRILESSFQPINAGSHILLHGHCYQKARTPAADGLPVGVQATQELLAGFGYIVQQIESGCCGMAGAFGYEQEHYAIAQKIAEYQLLPAIREQMNSQPGKFQLCTAGVSCDSQIADSLNIPVYHPVQLVCAAAGLDVYLSLIPG